MSIRVGVNGFGRIGRTFYRAIHRARDRGVDITLVGANDLGSIDEMANLLTFDSVAGRLDVDVTVEGRDLVVGEDRIRIMREADPTKLPWGELGADVVIESTRMLTDRDLAAAHLVAGARLVIISAPSANADATLVVGVNEEDFDPARHSVISMGSCTTNCLVPMVRVLNDAFGIEAGLMTTVHAVTGEQNLVDGPNPDLRRGRAGFTNIVPTSTGAARATREVIPAMAGVLDGSALRVPVLDGSLTDLTVIAKRPTSVAAVNAAFSAAAASGRLAKVLDYSESPLVSTDIVGRSASCTFDAPLTKVIDRLVKVFGWYDNEWGYSNRLVDLCLVTAMRQQAVKAKSKRLYAQSTPQDAPGRPARGAMT